MTAPPGTRRGAPAGQPEPLNVAAATTLLDAVHAATAVRQAQGAAPSRPARVRRQLVERVVEAARRGDHDLAAIALWLAEGAA